MLSNNTKNRINPKNLEVSFLSRIWISLLDVITRIFTVKNYVTHFQKFTRIDAVLSDAPFAQSNYYSFLLLFLALFGKENDACNNLFTNCGFDYHAVPQWNDVKLHSV